MPLELAELAAGLPFAASFAMAGGISALREGRRRTALNEAIHELRRPLQVIAFLAPGSADRAEALESSLRLAAAAVDRLDCEINGGPAPDPVEVTPVRPLVESAVERWRVRASLEGRVVNLKWEAGEASHLGDPVELAQVVDNLISNGVVHGSGEVSVEAKRVDDVLRLVVGNRKLSRAAGLRRRERDLAGRISGRRRHGHGLRIVRRVAARNGGSFRLRRRADRCEAVLELPLLGGSR
jgi:signal transduction histidine kinase